MKLPRCNTGSMMQQLESLVVCRILVKKTLNYVLRNPVRTLLCLVVATICFGSVLYVNRETLEDCKGKKSLNNKYMCLYHQTGFMNLEHILNYTVEEDVFKAVDVHSPMWITATTHTTVDRLHHLIPLSSNWDGPVSVAVFTPGEDVFVAKAFITFLRNIFPTITQNFSFHFLHVSPAPFETKNRPESFVDEEVSDEAKNSKFPVDILDTLLQQRSPSFIAERQKLWLPLNHIRNVAVKFVKTDYMFLLDVDILPKSGLHSKFVSLVERVEQNAAIKSPWALVVPTYEVEKGLPPPDSIKTLLNAVQEGKARQIHQVHFPPCQHATNHKKWEEYNMELPPQTDLHITYKVNYEDGYEPYYIAKLPIPKFSEQLVGYCRDKSSQAYSMYVNGYNYYVIDQAFNTHNGLEISRPDDWEIQCVLNLLVYKNVVKMSIESSVKE